MLPVQEQLPSDFVRFTIPFTGGYQAAMPMWLAIALSLVVAALLIATVATIAAVGTRKRDRANER